MYKILSVPGMSILSGSPGNENIADNPICLLSGMDLGMDFSNAPEFLEFLSYLDPLCPRGIGLPFKPGDSYASVA